MTIERAREAGVRAARKQFGWWVPIGAQTAADAACDGLIELRQEIYATTGTDDHAVNSQLLAEALEAYAREAEILFEFDYIGIGR